MYRNIGQALVFDYPGVGQVVILLSIGVFVAVVHGPGLRISVDHQQMPWCLPDPEEECCAYRQSFPLPDDADTYIYMFFVLSVFPRRGWYTSVCTVSCVQERYAIMVPFQCLHLLLVYLWLS